MNRTQKYLACTAIALSSMFAASAAADTPQEKLKTSDIKNIELRFHALRLDANSQAILNRLEHLGKLEKLATSQKNQELLPLTNMALEEMMDRLWNICLPLHIEMDKATLKENQALEARTQDRVSDSYKALHKQFLHACSFNIYPNIIILQSGPDAGKILSDVKLDRPALLQWARQYLFLAKAQLDDSKAHLQRYKNTSGVAYIKRMLRHMEASGNVVEECSKVAGNYADFLRSSNDLLEIRRQKAKLVSSCSQKVKF